MLSYAEINQKIKLILKPEWSYYVVSIIYGVGVSLFTLAIPISVQSLVNTVTFGALTQPLIVLTIVLLSLLVFSGVLNALQFYTIELFQRHFYARTTSDIATRLLNADYITLSKTNGVELVNRYFDVMTVQKSFTTLLTGGVAIVLQTIVGLVLLAFYHPYFLVFDLAFIFLLWLLWYLYGKKAMVTSVKESKTKYKVASWFEEMARVNLLFKSRERKEEAIRLSDQYIGEYIRDRKIHFKEVFYQNIFLLAIYAFMSAIVLGLAGFLVMDGQLTLGQLVASELVLTIILSSFAKASKYFEAFYDMYAAIDKLTGFYKLPAEKVSTMTKGLPSSYDIKFSNVLSTFHGRQFSFNCEFEQSKNYFVKSRFNSTKVDFMELIQCLTYPEKGKIEFGGLNFESLSPLDIRDQIYVVDKPQLFEGTILENLTLGREDISLAQIHEALDLVELDYIEEIFEDGLNTTILPSGFPLWTSQLIRVELARLILNTPQVVVFTSSIEQLEKNRREKILKYFLKSNSTVIYFSFRKAPQLDYHAYYFFEEKENIKFEDGDKFCQFLEDHHG